MEILAACKKHPKAFVRCSSEFPFFPGAQKIGDMIDAGAFGKIIEVQTGFLHSSDLDPNKATPVWAADDPREWLEKMNKALSTRNYDGTFFHISGGRVETMRIVHRVRSGRVADGGGQPDPNARRTRG